MGILIIRIFGIVLGICSFAFGIYMAVLDKPTANVGMYYAGDAGFLALGILLMLPWSKIRNNILFYGLLVLLTLSVLPIGYVLFASFVWAEIHGAAAWWEKIIAIGLGLALLSQIPAIYLSRKRSVGAV